MPSTADRYRHDLQLLSAVLEAIGSAIIVLDAGGLVRIWNSASERILRVPAGQALGRPFSSLPIAWDWEELNALVPGLVPDRPVGLDEIRLAIPGGNEAVLAFTITPIGPDRGGGCLWHGTDVSSRRSMETQLRQAQKLEAIGGLAAGIAHEINTPMQFVGDNVRFLVDATAGMRTVLEAMRPAAVRLPPEDRQAVERAESAVDLAFLLDEVPKALAQAEEGIRRVSAIVKAMKEFSHPGVDSPVPSDLNHLIESTLTVSRNTWKYVADLEQHLDPDLPPVPVVPGCFNQVILNLVVNAAHAIEDHLAGKQGKGRITVATSQRGGKAVIEVADTGCGIPEAIRRRIFDPFFTTKSPGRGTGQGLSQVHAEIVERLGGEVEFDSQVGAGTTFRIFIPLQPSATVRLRNQTISPRRSEP